jgi:hypothetical protein
MFVQIKVIGQVSCSRAQGFSAEDTTATKPFSPKQVGVGCFISIRVAKFLHWLAKPNTTLLLYQGLGPTMLGHLGTLLL